eukprot:GHVP01014893.1.p1 GENE.GHVP01014893.1~~GHVP01014893.1.p1  ORF type:complete len:223 (+),score=38.65 GHVP01014893.1:59-670(+)
MEFFGKLSEELTNTFVRPHPNLVEPDEQESGGVDFRSPSSDEEEGTPSMEVVTKICNEHKRRCEEAKQMEEKAAVVQRSLKKAIQARDARDFCSDVCLLIGEGKNELKQALDKGIDPEEKMRFTIDKLGQGYCVILCKKAGTTPVSTCSCCGACSCPPINRRKDSDFVTSWFVENKDLCEKLRSNSAYRKYYSKKYLDKFCKF